MGQRTRTSLIGRTARPSHLISSIGSARAIYTDPMLAHLVRFEQLEEEHESTPSASHCTRSALDRGATRNTDRLLGLQGPRERERVGGGVGRPPITIDYAPDRSDQCVP